MRLFNLFRREQKASPMDVLREMFVRSSWSGATVNASTALQATAVLACVRVIAEGLAQVPFRLYRDLAGGSKVVATDHPLYTVLAERPNDWQTSFEFREQIGMHLVLCGNAYVVKVLGRSGQVAELLAYEPQQVTVKRNDWTLSYEVSLDDGRHIAIPAAQMWHLRGPSWNGWEGLQAVKVAREAIGLGLAGEEHAARVFSNGARPGGVLSSDASLSPEQVKDLRESWERTQGGNANAFKTAILWGGLKWMPTGANNNDSRLLELRSMQVEEVCRAFRVIPLMVGYADKTATYASAEQMFLAHVVHTMGPWYARVEQSAKANLLTEADRREGYYTKFVAAGLMRGAHEARANYYSAALGAGGSPAWMTQDEVRALEELNPMGGTAAQLPVITNAPKPAEDKTAAVLGEMKNFSERLATAMASAKGDTHISVAAPTIDMKPAEVHNHLPEPVVQLEARIETPEPVVKVENHIKAGDTFVEMPATPAPEVKIVNNIAPAEISSVRIVGMPSRKTESRVERDARGNIVKTEQRETDA